MPNKGRTGAAGQRPGDAAMRLSRRLAEVERLKIAGHVAAARRECEALLRDVPGYVGALLTHGLICLKLQDFEKAYHSLTRANDLHPDDCTILTALARAKAHLGMADSAIRNLKAALNSAPGNLAALNTLSELYKLEGLLTDWERVLRQIISQDMSDPESKVQLARCLIPIGKLAESRALLKGLVGVGYISPNLLQAISLYPSDPDLIDLVSGTAHISGRSTDEQAAIKFVRATGLHWAGRHDEAWALFCEGNAIRAGQLGAGWAAQRETRRNLLRRNEMLPADEADRVSMATGTCPLFVLGASRSGKSAIERLLAAAPSVACGYEHAISIDVLRRVMNGSRCTNVNSLFDMPPELGATYASEFAGTLQEKAQGADVFVSAGPEPIGDALLLNKYIPGSRFVFIRRNRRDHAFRIFMTDYHGAALGMSCSSDLQTIQEYLDWYEGLIDICAEKMPGQCIVLDYDEVVQDPAGTTARILSLCGAGAVPPQLPDIGDDRDVAAPYARWLDPALGL